MNHPMHLIIPEHSAGERLDIALQVLLPEHSRSRLQAWIKSGLVTLNTLPASAKTKVWGGEKIAITLPTLPQELASSPENIPLDILFEDDTLLVINKPAGLVVHPAAGHWQGTLVNALLFHAPQLQALPRAGIVHRLDKDTSGLLVVAKTLEAQTHLVRQLQARTVKREYRVIVWGQVWHDGKVDAPIRRDARNRLKMAVDARGKPAITHYQVLERFSAHSYLRCLLETGRTHQIRVHFQHLKAPVVGDPLYGYHGIAPHTVMMPALCEALKGFQRQALHATKLGLIHPYTQKMMHWEVALADDMSTLLEVMRYQQD